MVVVWNGVQHHRRLLDSMSHAVKVELFVQPTPLRLVDLHHSTPILRVAYEIIAGRDEVIESLRPPFNRNIAQEVQGIVVCV